MMLVNNTGKIILLSKNKNKGDSHDGLHHTFLLCFYAEIKEMIYEIVNLKGVVYI